MASISPVARRVAFWLAAILIVLATAVAQEFRGAIRGRITDPSGAAVPNVQVVATKIDTGVSTSVETNAEGNYQAPYLQPGFYRVRMEAPGFKSVERPRVEVVISQTVTLNIALELGASSQTVTLNTADGDLGMIINKRLVDDVPVSIYRNAVELTQLAGVTGSVNNGYTSTSQR